jgi:inner membrane protein
MPSLVSHAAVGVALGTALRPAQVPKRFWVLGALCAVLPDLDVLGGRLGLRSADVLAHRGLSHSLLIAAFVGGVVTSAAFGGSRWRGVRGRLWTYFAIATASHGLLDALTAYGPGIAFFAPFSAERFFLPWRPITGSVAGTAHSFVARALAVIAGEVAWIWLPSLLLAGTALLARRARTQHAAGTDA